MKKILFGVLLSMLFGTTFGYVATVAVWKNQSSQSYVVCAGDVHISVNEQGEQLRETDLSPDFELWQSTVLTKPLIERGIASNTIVITEHIAPQEIAKKNPLFQNIFSNIYKKKFLGRYTNATQLKENFEVFGAECRLIGVIGEEWFDVLCACYVPLLRNLGQALSFLQAQRGTGFDPRRLMDITFRELHEIFLKTLGQYIDKNTFDTYLTPLLSRQLEKLTQSLEKKSAKIDPSEILNDIISELFVNVGLTVGALRNEYQAGIDKGQELRNNFLRASRNNIDIGPWLAELKAPSFLSLPDNTSLWDVLTAKAKDDGKLVSSLYSKFPSLTWNNIRAVSKTKLITDDYHRLLDISVVTKLFAAPSKNYIIFLGAWHIRNIQALFDLLKPYGFQWVAGTSQDSSLLAPLPPQILGALVSRGLRS